MLAVRSVFASSTFPVCVIPKAIETCQCELSGQLLMELQ